MSQPPNPPNPPNPQNPPPPPHSSAPNAPNASYAPPPKSNNKTCLIIGGIVLAVFIVGAFVAVSLIGSWIKGGTEKLVEKATGAAGVSIVNNDDEQGLSFKDKDGNEFQVTASKEIPADFPKDAITLYDGTISRTGRTKIGDKTMWTVLVTTPDTHQQVASFIADQLAKDGWEVVTEQDSDNTSIRIAKTADYNMTISYSRNRSNNQTNINYMVQTQDKSE